MKSDGYELITTKAERWVPEDSISFSLFWDMTENFHNKWSK